jgi:hypothetical protein
MTTKGQGKAYRWLVDHKGHDGDYCLIWPFYRNPNGYGQLGYLGESYWAHRFMCELVHGAPPTPEHEAAHSCGNGSGGCANPKHLSWKTRTGNLLDCREHGTQARSCNGNKGRLTDDQVMQIRALKGKKTQDEIAFTFGVSPPTVRDIFLGRSHAAPSKIKHWKPEEDEQLAKLLQDGLTHEEIAKIIGRPQKAVSGHAARLGLRSRRGSGGILMPLNAVDGQSTQVRK